MRSTSHNPSSAPLEPTATGTRLNVVVQAGAHSSEIKGLHGDRLKIKTSVPAQDGKANKELIRMLARELNLSKSRISIRRGQKSRQKTIDIADVSPGDIKDQLGLPQHI